MAVSVFDSRLRWGGEDSGVALYGKCRMSKGTAAISAERLYSDRFKAYSKWRREVPPESEAAAWRFFSFTPNRVKVFDEPHLGAGVFVTALVQRQRW